ncbi:MAG TPA: response regulator [Cyclobacteriaceae bacterium]|nr:response regulator [Cyclobacteriaceae bacterium]
MKKILIIEDNPDIRDNTEELLTLANYQVCSADNGKKGVEVAIREKPDLIICDIMMPELDGYGVLHVLSKRDDTSAIPFIFLTAMTEKSEIRKGMELGADDYLTKPFDDTELLNAIEARLRKINIRQKNYAPTTEGFEALVRDAGNIIKLDDLGKGRKTISVKKKAEIFAEGDTPASVFLVKSGEIKVSRLHQDGKELITNIYLPNDFFGFEAVLENSPYGESAAAMADSEIIVIPKDDFLALIFANTDVSAVFISMLCRKVAAKENDLLNLAYSSIRQRTAAALLKVNERKDKNGYINMSREDLARMVGTASESVIRVLAEFKDEKIVSADAGRLKIESPERLEKVIRWNVAR